MRELRKGLLTLPTGVIRPEVADVLLSGLKDARRAKGPSSAARSPSRRTPRLAVEACLQAGPGNVRRFLGPDDRSGPPGRG